MNKQIIYGTLLGDAYFQKHNNNKMSGGLRYTHSEKQKEYALQKAVNINSPFTYRERIRHDKRTNKDYTSIEIYHNVNIFLKEMQILFYPDNKKIITNKLLNKLGKQSIAIQYCDDGNLYITKNTKILELATNGFDDISRNNIIKYFYNKWNIEFVPTKKGSIRLTSLKKIKQFMNLFGSYIPECMNYKYTDYESTQYNRVPSKEKIIELRKDYSVIQIAKMYQISDTSIYNKLNK